MKCLVIGFTAKDGNSEFTSIKGYKLKDHELVPPHTKVRADCLLWANNEGGNFSYLQINFMNVFNEKDYNSFMGLNT